MYPSIDNISTQIKSKCPRYQPTPDALEAIERATQQALFQAAKDGNLRAVYAILVQPDVFQVVERSNANFQRWRSQLIQSKKSSFLENAGVSLYRGGWILYRLICGDENVIFTLVIQHDQLHVLEFFLSLTSITATLLTHLHDMCAVAIAHDRVEAIELILKSNLFQKQLTSGERHHVLQEFLHQAIQKRRPDIIRLVVAHGARVNAVRVKPVRGPDDPHNQLENPLTRCAQSGDVACLRVLLASGVVCALYPTLGRYDKYWDVQLVRAFINAGLDTCGKGVSALHFACHVRALESVEALITVGFADVNAVSKHGLTPLMAAVISEGGGDSAYSVVALLLASNADASLRLVNGETVLHVLTDGCRGVETLRLLLTAAPEIVNAQDAGGVTAMRNLVQFFNSLENSELLDVLLDTEETHIFVTTTPRRRIKCSCAVNVDAPM